MSQTHGQTSNHVAFTCDAQFSEKFTPLRLMPIVILHIRQISNLVYPRVRTVVQVACMQVACAQVACAQSTRLAHLEDPAEPLAS